MTIQENDVQLFEVISLNEQRHDNDQTKNLSDALEKEIESRVIDIVSEKTKLSPKTTDRIIKSVNGNSDPIEIAQIILEERISPDSEQQLALESVQNMYLLSEGKISKEDAAKKMAKSASRLALKKGLSKDVVKKQVTNSLAKAAKSIGNKTLKKAVKGYGSIIGTIAAVATMSVVNSLASEDEVTAEKIFSDLFDEATKDVGSTIQAVSLVIPIPGLSVAVSLGLMAISVCSALRQTAKLANDELEQKFIYISSIEKQALEEMSYQREILKTLIKEKYQAWDDKIDSAFQTILSGTLNNDVDEISLGIDTALSIIGKNVRFKTTNEFNEFFMNESAEFTF